MIETFRSGGIIMWPLLAIAVGILVMILRALTTGRKQPPAGSRRERNTILFWGLIGALLGLLGTVVGLVQMARNIQRAGPVDPQLVWGHVSVTLVSLVFGLLILLFGAGSWLILDRWGHAASRRMDTGA